MLPWPLTEDDQEAIEAEQLYQERTEEERHEELRILEQMDVEDTEDQDELDRHWHEAVAGDPYALLAQAEFETTTLEELRKETEEHRIWDKLERQMKVSQLTTQLPDELPSTAPETSFPQITPTPIQRFIPKGDTPQIASQVEQLPTKSIPIQRQPQPAKRQKLKPREVANIFCTTENLVISGNAIYMFKGRNFEFMSKESMRREIVRRCRTAVEEVGTSGFVEDVFRCIFDEPNICHHDIQPSPDELVFLDGVLNLKTGRFGAHSPEIFATSYLEANYCNGLATACPKFDHFVATIANGGTLLERRIWEMLGYILSQDQRGKVFFVLQGPSGTGKSVLGNFIRGCFNKEAVSALALHAFGENFLLSDLIGKRLCADLDLSGETINSKAASYLKKMTGGDLLTTNVKYMPPVSFMNTAKLLFSTNHALFTEVFDDAFQGRIIVVPFSVIIPQSEWDTDLVEHLSEERDAVVVKALSAYCALRDHNYIFSGEFVINATVDGGSNLADKVTQFVFENCVEAADVWTPTSTFYEQFIKEFGRVCNDIAFSKLFFQIISGAVPSAKRFRKRVNRSGNPISGFVGLILRDND